MEHPSSTSLFSLNIEPLTKSHLQETARWARFLAIVGMVALLIMVLVGIFFSTMFTSVVSQVDPDAESSPTGMFNSFGIGMAIAYILLSIVWFFPLLYLLRFANKMKAALNGNDQQALNVSVQNLKICFRYIGIITIILLALYALIFIFGIVGAAAFS